MSANLLNQVRQMNGVAKQFKAIVDYIEKLNPKQAKFIKENTTDTDKSSFVEECLRDGIRIHQPPFFGSIDLKELKQMFKEHHELVARLEFTGVEMPMVMGKVSLNWNTQIHNKKCKMHK